MRGSQLGEQSYLAVERPKKTRPLVVNIAGQSLTVSRKKKKPSLIFSYLQCHFGLMLAVKWAKF